MRLVAGGGMSSSDDSDEEQQKGNAQQKGKFWEGSSEVRCSVPPTTFYRGGRGEGGRGV